MSTHSHLVRPVSRLFRRLTVLGVASAAVVGAGVGVGVGVQPAGAAGTTVYVSSSATSDPSCASASQTDPFATIQQALVCAPSGSTVLVGSGTFVGQVTVNRNVNLQGAGPTTVIRRSPGFTNLAANVTVTDGRTVTLQNLTVDGVDRTTAGVAAGSGHLTLRDVDVVNNGNVFGNAGGLSVSPASGTATVLVLNSTIANNS